MADLNKYQNKKNHFLRKMRNELVNKKNFNYENVRLVKLRSYNDNQSHKKIQ